MALKQSRRSISFPGAVYAAIVREADVRGVTASRFVVDVMRTVLPGLPATTHFDIEVAEKAANRRAAKMAVRRTRDRG